MQNLSYAFWGPSHLMIHDLALSTRSFRKPCSGGLGSHLWSVQRLSAPIMGVEDDQNHVAGNWIFFPHLVWAFWILHFWQRSWDVQVYRWLQFMGKQHESKRNKPCQLPVRSLGSTFAEKLFYNWVNCFHFSCASFSSRVYPDAAGRICLLSLPMHTLLPLS